MNGFVLYKRPVTSLVRRHANRPGVKLAAQGHPLNLKELDHTPCKNDWESPAPA
jgi:hypothetical protein